MLLQIARRSVFIDYLNDIKQVNVKNLKRLEFEQLDNSSIKSRAGGTFQ